MIRNARVNTLWADTSKGASESTIENGDARAGLHEMMLGSFVRSRSNLNHSLGTPHDTS